MNRYIYIDNIKVFGNILRCMIHASVPYMVTYSAMWPFDDAGSYVFDFAIFESHLFLMELFLLLTGFMFGAQLRKKSTSEIVASRFQKIVLPFLAGLIVLMPIVLSYFQLQETNTYNWMQWETISQAYQNAWHLGLNNFFPTGHLWFLYYLLYFYLFSLIANLRRTQIIAFLERFSFFKILVVAIVISILCFFFMKRWLVDNPLTLIPEWPSLVHYYLFFFLGIVLNNSNQLNQSLDKNRKQFLILGAILGLVAIVPQFFFEQKDHPYFYTIKTIAIVLHATATFLLTFGLWSYFKNNSNRYNKTVHYLSDANYWIYITFLPTAMFIQLLLLPIGISIFFKFLITYFGGLAICLLTYEYLVRYTWIGATLNSRKFRTKNRT